MNKTWFVGVDISKATLDFAFCQKNRQKLEDSHFQVCNNRKGISEALKLLHSKGITKSNMWVCMEHTGDYTFELWKYLEENNICCTVANAMNIKRSMNVELSRGKSDKVDAYRIAWYCTQNHEDLKPTRMPSEVFLRLKILNTERRGYVRQRASHLSRRNTYGIAKYEQANDRLEKTISVLKMNIKSIEKEMLTLIESDADILNNYNRLISIPGISFVNAVNTIVYTVNFMSFENARQYACYAGVAPFAYSSGSSVKGRTRVSKAANTQIKADLTQAAKCAVIWDSELRNFYNRKTVEGKDYGKIMNAVKFKLIERMFAVIHNKRDYVKLATYMS